MKFTKLQGAGNDFIIINNIAAEYSEEALQQIARRVCQRKVSVGADGLMALNQSVTGADFQMLYINADGSIGEMCGNGARCIARYAFENGIAGSYMKFDTTAGEVKAWRINQRLYKIQLNNPTKVQDYSIQIDNQIWDCSYIELGDPGVPHVVLLNDKLNEISRQDLMPLARKIRFYDAFPKGANVNFCKLTGDNKAIAITYERGVEDFTLACGTGCGATALALWQQELVHPDGIALSVPGGILHVDIKTNGSEVEGLFLTGDTNMVATGDLLDEDLDISAF